MHAAGFSNIYVMAYYRFDIVAVRAVSNIDPLSSELGADLSYDTGPMPGKYCGTLPSAVWLMA